LKKYKAG